MTCVSDVVEVRCGSTLWKYVVEVRCGSTRVERGETGGVLRETEIGKLGGKGRVGEWESGRVGEWESGRVGEWESGRQGSLEHGRTCVLVE